MLMGSCSKSFSERDKWAEKAHGIAELGLIPFKGTKFSFLFYG